MISKVTKKITEGAVIFSPLENVLIVNKLQAESGRSRDQCDTHDSFYEKRNFVSPSGHIILYLLLI